MKVQQIKQAVELEGLEDWGTAALPGTDPVRVSGRQMVIPGLEAIDTGVFECSPGAYRRSVKQAEVMHFIAGAGIFTPDGEDTIHFRSGDTLFFEAQTEGLWEVVETMRKIYVIF
ncbi:Nucleoside-diphosphate-sugar epimerase [Candidatus Burkholderia verschuerenii]|uniref:Nucleoside-diphosphate-sugar epimerase n=1 Tax=Candidatus Burkholderia verschuerenii TaxID=242163 RepID=A0A0L0MIK4_9BURK|nr:cupin domain-containing protein [Candidatus Burkholderia verschuerenii]KND62128.1 Nucleoside-diphosphate-sugar epimerase [Candidatus Burkholderia verschuerenii]